MTIMKRRVAALEQKFAPRQPGRVHAVLWPARTPWADALSNYDDSDDVRPGDDVIIISFVEGRDGAPVPDPIHARDRPIADAWAACG